MCTLRRSSEGQSSRRSKPGVVLVRRLSDCSRAARATKLYAVIYRARCKYWRQSPRCEAIYERNYFAPRCWIASKTKKLSPTHNAVDINDHCDTIVALFWILITLCIASNCSAHFFRVVIHRCKAHGTFKCEPTSAVDL